MACYEVNSSSFLRCIQVPELASYPDTDGAELIRAGYPSIKIAVVVVFCNSGT